MRRIALLLAASLLVVATALAGSAAARPKQAATLNIYAAASLTEVFRAARSRPALQLRGLERARDADPTGRAGRHLRLGRARLNTQNLFRAGLVQRPVTFTANRLALIVPKSNPAEIHTVYDLRSKPVKLVIAAPAVPVGGYTRTVLRKMGLTSVLQQGGQPGVGREGRDRQGRARPGRRRLRLRRRMRGRFGTT